MRASAVAKACLAMAAAGSAGAAEVALKKFMVTGSTDGIGRFTCERLAAAGHSVVVHGRTPAKVDDVLRDLEQRRQRPEQEFTGYCADLSNMEQVRQLGREVAAAHPQLDGLLNNAGTFSGDYTGKRKVTEEGNEYSLAVNVMAPFLLTSLLLESVRRSGAGRILVTSSISMGAADALSDLQCEQRWDEHRAYSLSKLCDAMMVLEMHKRYGAPPSLCFNTMDPGTVNTKMLRAGWGFAGAPVSSATTSFKMLTEDKWDGRSGESACGLDRECKDPSLRRQLWDDLVALTGAEWP